MRRLILLVGIVASSCGGNSGSPIQPPPPPPDVAITCPQPITVPSPLGQPMPVTYGDAIASAGVPPTTVACTPASATTFPIGTTTVTCTATDSRQQTATCSFGVTVSAPPRLSVTRFFAFGDSMTYGEIGDSLSAFANFYSPTLNYPAVLRRLLTQRYSAQTVVVDNYGNPGERAADPATRSRFSSISSSRRYDVALILEGANDIADRDSRAIAPAAAALQQMVRDAKSRGMQAFLATIPPEDPNRCSPTCRGLGYTVVEPMNAAIRNVAAAEAVPLVDVYAALVTNVGANIGADGLHPTETGMAKIADTFFAAIRQALEPASPTFTPLLARPF